ncbi:MULTISPECIES: GyrI-like domain-containing protein [unclassified Massilia]|uniref:GyrI-like domain-containing protein n=1 Tax=unclassified Massilia TaxID=2609279 RepID=UPI0017842841|nr:GyrI-like domain-containing protein [Massilia sp. CFBP 13647]MBD8672610.1 GyrI-like domain-containing protein [Massilia sp. CFBP 13721]
MSDQPRIEMRPERPYVGTRAVIAMRDFEQEIPAMTATVSHWLDARHVRPAGPPFLRYHAIDMPERMDVELGMPTDHAHDATGQVESRLLPAGRYAVLLYTGVRNGVSANRELIDWIAAQGEHIAQEGQVFQARYETFLTDAEAEPDQQRWRIEVAIGVRG